MEGPRWQIAGRVMARLDDSRLSHSPTCKEKRFDLVLS